MAKFYGAIGYGSQVESVPGVWKDVIVEHNVFGDVLQNSAAHREADKVNDDLTVSVRISIVRDTIVDKHYFAIRYLFWQGVRWKVASVEPLGVRLILRLGGVYHGTKPS